MNKDEQESQVSAPLRHAYEILQELTDELERELDIVLKADQQNHKDFRKWVFPQVERRILVRSIFSYIEAITFAIKALILSDPHSSKLTEGERLMASELSYELKSTGDVSIRHAKISLASNIRFTFKMFSKVFGSWTPLDTGGHDWECLQRSIKVRDRITHPKRVSDLFITDVELDEAYSAIVWFHRSHIRASLEMFAVSRDWAKKLKDHAATIMEMKEWNQLPVENRARLEKIIEEVVEEVPETLASVADKLIEERDRLAGKETSNIVNERERTQ